LTFLVSTFHLSSSYFFDVSLFDISHFDVSGEIQLPPTAYLINVRDKASCTVSIIHPKWVLASYACLADT
jgi:hypothetical protein